MPFRKSDEDQTLTIDRSREHRSRSQQDHARDLKGEVPEVEPDLSRTEVSKLEESSRWLMWLASKLERNWALSAALMLAAIALVSIL